MWTYDDAGNILSRTEYAYTTADDPGTALDTVTYAYTNENWGDLLKTYDGGTLYYDNCGNLTSDPTWRYTWEHGRQLASMAAKDGSVTWNYEYDVDGLRLSRTDGTTEYGYVYLGGELVRMTIDDDVVMLFAYDADGTPMSVVYNGTTYYYAKNVQGDVVAILSNTGKPVVYYTYDAWGNILSITGTKASTLGQDNPLRYRGYVYDTETELYYLQSRYYNPEVGRFINADGFVSTGQGFVGNNMFAYCGNNPVNRMDPSGLAYSSILNKGMLNQFGSIQEEYSGSIGGVIILPGTLIDALCDAYSDIKNAITSYVDSISSSEEIRDQSVYVLKDANGLVRYVGRTNDPVRRANEHKNDPTHPWRREYTMTVVASGLTLQEAKLYEQALISAYSLAYLENARREIAAKNIPGFYQYVDALGELITGWDVSTIMEFLEG